MEDTRRIVLLGKSGAGKSYLGNTILEDYSAFKVDHSANSGTQVCSSVTRRVHGRKLTLIDTPGFFDTNPNNSESAFSPEIMKCLEASAPGPHAFILILKVEKYTPQEQAVVNLILQYFSDEALRYTTIVFTHGNDLPPGRRIEDWARENGALRDLLARCGNRCHVVDNRYWINQQGATYQNNRNQVQDLLNTIELAVAANGGSYFTGYLLQNPSLWQRFRGAPIGVQMALILGVPVVSVLLYKFVPWPTISHWVIMTAREGVAWARRNLPSNEDLIQAVAYLANLLRLFNQTQQTREVAKSVCTVL